MALIFEKDSVKQLKCLCGDQRQIYRVYLHRQVFSENNICYQLIMHCPRCDNEYEFKIERARYEFFEDLPDIELEEGTIHLPRGK